MANSKSDTGIKTATPAQAGGGAAKSKPAGRTGGSSAGFRNILCAVDGTRGSMAAVRLAASLAGGKGHVTLLTVSGITGSAAAISPSRAKQVLERARLLVEKAGVQASTILDTEGRPVEVILERAAEHDLLAMGPPASSWLGGMLLSALSVSFGGILVGGVTPAVLGRFSTPVLIVRGTASRSLEGRTILVASDGEADSDRIVEVAAAIGKGQHAVVTLVNALEGESHTNARQIQAQVQRLRRKEVSVADPVIEPGSPAEIILRASKSGGAALLVMGSRRLSGLRALGSVSRRVAHDAGCSVLLLPPAS